MPLCHCKPLMGTRNDIYKLILARLDRRAALCRCLGGIFQKSLNRLTLLETLEAIHHAHALEDLFHGFSRQSAVLHPMIRRGLL